MQNNNNNYQNQEDSLLDEYADMITKFVNQNSDKDFDEIVNEIKEKFDGKLKEIAEEIIKENLNNENDDNDNSDESQKKNKN